MYRRGRTYSRRPYNRRKRPTNRVIQAGTVQNPLVGQVVGYLFTATDPCTATNFMLDTGVYGGTASSVAYALVYVPDGYSVNNIAYPSVPPANFYEPSQNVLISGVLSDQGIEDNKMSRYSRKMQTGDRIALVYYCPAGTANSAFELSFTTMH